MTGHGPGVTGRGVEEAPGVPSSTRGPRPSALLDVRGLTVAYPGADGRLPALRDVTLSVAPGEMVGLVGPNGSGKTTVIRAVIGVVRPLAGRVLICGDDAAGLSANQVARRLAVVPQDPRLPDAFTALEAVLMGRTPHLHLLQSEGPADLDAARRAMLASDTWDLAARRLGELSGGERQRVVVARALAQETPVLLLDEPTAHLDIGHQAAVLELVLRLCLVQGKAVLAAVHDLTLAAQFCQRLVMLHHGEVIAGGSAAEVLRPDLLERVYGARVRVFPHPDSGQPVVAPRPAQE